MNRCHYSSPFVTQDRGAAPMQVRLGLEAGWIAAFALDGSGFG